MPELIPSHSANEVIRLGLNHSPSYTGVGGARLDGGVGRSGGGVGGDTNSIWPSALPRLKRSNVIRTEPYAPYRFINLSARSQDGLVRGGLEIDGNAAAIQRSHDWIDFYSLLFNSYFQRKKPRVVVDDIMLNIHVINLFLPRSL